MERLLIDSQKTDKAFSSVFKILGMMSSILLVSCAVVDPNVDRGGYDYVRYTFELVRCKGYTFWRSRRIMRIRWEISLKAGGWWTSSHLVSSSLYQFLWGW